MGLQRLKSKHKQILREIIFSTVWKLQNLNEINFGDSRISKLTVLAHLEARKFDFYEILHVLEA